jgi:hypothetical protein
MQDKCLVQKRTCQVPLIGRKKNLKKKEIQQQQTQFQRLVPWIVDIASPHYRKRCTAQQKTVHRTAKNGAGHASEYLKEKVNRKSTSSSTDAPAETEAVDEAMCWMNNGENATAFRWPVALARANRFFPGTGCQLINEIASKAQRFRPGITDQELAAMLEDTHRTLQKSAGLWLHTVPDYVRNYLPIKPRGRVGDEID